MTAMLASVRDLAEAAIVARCGVEWIDLKEPRQGALGAVPLPTVKEVVARYGRSHRVSATIGDCWETPEVIPGRVADVAAAGVGYVKVGAFARAPGKALLSALDSACCGGARVILVCFAEEPPAVTDIPSLAETGIVGMMLDTAHKHGKRLPQVLDAGLIAGILDSARGRGLLTGLAGSLVAEDVPGLQALAPDYLGFRGALCRGGRTAAVDERAVRALRESYCWGTAAVGTHPSVQDPEVLHGVA